MYFIEKVYMLHTDELKMKLKVKNIHILSLRSVKGTDMAHSGLTDMYMFLY